MAPFRGFIGETYQARAINADAERSVNFYPERIESPTGQGKTTYTFLSKPGLAAFATLADADSVPVLCAINGRLFAIARQGPSNYFYEVLANGASTKYSPALAGDVRPQMCASQTQVLILSGGLGYIFDLRANTLTAIADPDFPLGAVKCGFLDGYFIVLEPNSQTFAISALNDGTNWDPLDFGSAEGEPGNIVTFVVDQRQIWFLGNNHGEVYYNSGNANFPITRLEGAFMEQGAAAIDSAVKIDNTIMWLGANGDGAGIVWRANGYTPQRVSTYAIEALIESFGGISDAVAYPYQESGHTFYVLHFPSANQGIGATLVYDVGEQLWHERASWDTTLGMWRGDRARCHAYAWGKHLVGDYLTGNIYEQSMDYATDAGNPIRRLRSSPDIANGGKWMFYGELRLLMDVGVGLDGGGPPVVTQATAYAVTSYVNPAGDGEAMIGFQWAEGGLGAQIMIDTQQPYAKTTTAFNLSPLPDPANINDPSVPMLFSIVSQTLGSLPSSASLSVFDLSVVIKFSDGSTETWKPSAFDFHFGTMPANPGYAYDDSLETAALFVPGGAGRTEGDAITFVKTDGQSAPAAGIDPQMILQVSNDGGKTWSSERPASMGKLGDYRKLVRWRRLGRSNNRAFRVICSEPVRVALVAVDLDAQAGN